MNAAYAALFEVPERDDYRTMRFYLTYRRAMGGGTNLTRTDVDGMTLDDVRWEWRKLSETWQIEDRKAGG